MREWVRRFSGNITKKYNVTEGHFGILICKLQKADTERYAWKMLIGKPERQRPLGRPSCRWEYNIKTYLKATECGNVNWI
jgi:hypothetical protein